MLYIRARRILSHLSALYKQRFLRYLSNNYSAEYSTAAANYSVVQLLVMGSLVTVHVYYIFTRLI